MSDSPEPARRTLRSVLSTFAWCIGVVYMAVCAMFLAQYWSMGPFGPAVHVPMVPWLGAYEVILSLGPLALVAGFAVRHGKLPALFGWVVASGILLAIGSSPRGEGLIDEYSPAEVGRLAAMRRPVYLTITQGRGSAPAALALPARDGFRLVFPNGTAWTMRTGQQSLGGGWDVAMDHSTGVLFLRSPARGRSSEQDIRSVGSMQRDGQGDARTLAQWPSPMPSPLEDSPDETVLRLFKALAGFPA